MFFNTTRLQFIYKSEATALSVGYEFTFISCDKISDFVSQKKQVREVATQTMSFEIHFPPYNLTQHVCVIVCYGTSFIVTSTIFIFECNKRRDIQKNQDLKKINTTINNKSLGYSSLFALFCSPMAQIGGILTKVPKICPWPMYSIAVEFWTNMIFFLTFYQIARLKYCFSTKNSSKYGYPDKLFIILNIYGALILFSSISMFIPQYTFWSSEPNGYFGCKYKTTQIYPFMAIYASIAYISWDWFLLLLYMIKIIQFRRKLSSQNDIVIKKVLFILNKIFSLTIISEIVAGIIMFIHQYSKSNFLWQITGSIHAMIVSLILFLMIEHNNDYYVHIIQRLNAWNLCVCCKSSIQQVIDHHENNNEEDRDKETNAVGSICDTGNISSNHLDVKHRSMVMSELTVTNMENNKQLSA